MSKRYFMTFPKTYKAFAEGRQTVTRRKGWARLRPGDIIKGVARLRGVAVNDVNHLGTATVVDVRREPLKEITEAEVRLEGYEDISVEQYVKQFCLANNCGTDVMVTRIAFELVQGEL